MPCFFVGYTLSPWIHPIRSLMASYDQTLPEDRRLLSYNHLLFRPTLVLFPPTGLGVGGGSEKRLDAVLRLKELVLALKGLGDPYDDRRPPLYPTAFWSSGLAAGEYGEPLSRVAEAGLPFADRGELAGLGFPTDPFIEGVRVYRGGVL